MAFYYDPAFIESVKKEPEDRTLEDVHLIQAHLHCFEVLSSFRESGFRHLACTVRYEIRLANDILYYRGEMATCWFILLSGSVFIDGSMYLPRSSFGKRSTGSPRRANECLVLEPSEMLVIDYPDVEIGGGRHANQRQTCLGEVTLEGSGSSQRIVDPDQLSLEFVPGTTMVGGVLSGASSGVSVNSGGSGGKSGISVSHILPRTDALMKSNRSSHSSDTSSAYSGSDTMQSVHSSSLDDHDHDVDLSGLIESAVDSDEEEDLAESIDSLTVRDTVRECLEKYPQDRTEDDIETLLEFMQHLPAFANMTLSVRRALCAVMVFAVVEKAGTVVMNDGEELDSWSVIVNGHVEVEMSNGSVQELNLGDSFGITPTMEKLYHQGVMRTKVDDCQFVCITQTDYYHILHQGEENTRKHEEDGEVVLITEHRVLDGGNRRGHIVIKGTPDRLLSQLVEENSIIDPTYVEDFLLTHRTFISSPLEVANQLLHWFHEMQLRDKVTRVVLLWVNNHFTDFETDPEMMEFLEKFELGLEKEKMQGQLRLLNIACAAKARSRTVTLARSTRDEALNFCILGGYESGYGIFISKIEKGSKAEDVGLKRGDQILEVNRQSFEHITHSRALEILRGSTHLSITVKSNLLAFKELLATPDNSPRARARKASMDIARLQADPKARLSTHVDWVDHPCPGVITIPPLMKGGHIGSPLKAVNEKKEEAPLTERKGFMTLGHKARLKKALKKMNIIPKAINSESNLNNSDDSLYTSPPPSTCSSAGSGAPNGACNRYQHPAAYHSPGGSLYHSHSNPDLTSLHPFYDPAEIRPDYPEHVLKVYRSDQTCKYLLVHKETTAREVVMLSLREFGITDPSSNYSLCEVTVGEGGVIKQRRLPDQLQNLAERIGLSSRYYLKNNNSTETLVPDDLAAELQRESQVHFLQLNSVEVAVQLTLIDFSILRHIEPTEYVDDLFSLQSKYGVPMLSQFAELVNKEMFWVVSEVCSEHNLVRRSKILKHFIKVARQCKECKNFNSMFAIVSGLGHGAVSRLRATWEKLPTKYQKLYSDMQDLMDPSRNMSKYRNLISSEQIQPPIIPFYPVVKKDLTFIHLGNDTKVDGLINFEKLRMIAKEIRQLSNMCSAPYDLFTMLELGGAHPSAAMVSMNQLTVGTASLATFKRRKKSTGLPNPKKMFEEAQMVRRVKAYLSNLKVISDEEGLHHMSMECEAMVGGTTGGPLSAAPVRKRHPSPTLSTASSNSSTSEGKKSVGSGPKFGTDSPQAVRKMMALCEQSRPHQRHHGPPLHTVSALALLPSQAPHLPSPGPSPLTVRRGRSEVRGPHTLGLQMSLAHLGGHTQPPACNPPLHHGHGRSHSDTTPPTIGPVHLSAESSSVTSLNNLPLRKSQTSGSSVTSSDSSVGSVRITTSNSGDADSGSYSQIDSHSTSSVGSANSPPVQRRNCKAPHSPPLSRLCGHSVPPFPHAIPVLPPLHGYTALRSHVTHPQGNGSSGGAGDGAFHRMRKPPDYTIAAQMARNRQLARLGRAHSHEGVASNNIAYCNSDVTDPEDDEEETQVSAV